MSRKKSKHEKRRKERQGIKKEMRKVFVVRVKKWKLKNGSILSKVFGEREYFWGVLYCGIFYWYEISEITKEAVMCAKSVDMMQELTGDNFWKNSSFCLAGVTDESMRVSEAYHRGKGVVRCKKKASEMELCYYLTLWILSRDETRHQQAFISKMKKFEENTSFVDFEVKIELSEYLVFVLELGLGNTDVEKIAEKDDTPSPEYY